MYAYSFFLTYVLFSQVKHLELDLDLKSKHSGAA